jgi:hypothetical protein
MQCCNCDSELFWDYDDTSEDMDGNQIIESYLNCYNCKTKIIVLTPTPNDGAE